MDNSGNSFGEKVDLDIIVEDDCSESVILAEMMQGGDMSMSMDMNFMAGKAPARDERVSMMIHRQSFQQKQGAGNQGVNQPGMVGSLAGMNPQNMGQFAHLNVPMNQSQNRSASPRQPQSSPQREQPPVGMPQM